MYFKYGGLPYLKNLELTDRIVNEYLTNIYNSIIYRDIVSRYHVRSTYFLEQLVRFLSANIGSLFSAKRISDYLKSQQVNIPPNQVQTYISYLAKAFIIHRLQRYDIQGKRVFEMGEKLYFENMGIRNSICGYRPDDQGKLMENIVLNHLLVKGYAVHVGSFKGQEIDFLASREGELKYIQVALYLHEEKTIKREFGNLLNIKDNYPKMVVTMDKKFPNTYEGITHYTLRDFLLNEL
jgi:predicted AAA+ superfamily ATPase